MYCTCKSLNTWKTFFHTAVPSPHISYETYFLFCLYMPRWIKPRGHGWQSWSCSMEHSSFVHIYRGPSLNMNAVYIFSISQALITTPEAEDQLCPDLCRFSGFCFFFLKPPHPVNSYPIPEVTSTKPEVVILWQTLRKKCIQFTKEVLFLKRRW